MLEIDPLKRITISEIRSHPWFQVNLPKYLMYPPQVSARMIENLDQDIVLEIAQKFAVEKDTVLESLTQGEKTGEVNEFLVAYHLIYDNKKMYTGINNLL
jgi:hypothetical protein